MQLVERRDNNQRLKSAKQSSGISMYNSSTKRGVRTPIVVGMLVAAGAVTAVVIIFASDALKQPAPPENPYPSIEIEMARTTYQTGERLDFAIHTFGICATPNVTIWRYEGNE